MTSLSEGTDALAPHGVEYLDGQDNLGVTKGMPLVLLPKHPANPSVSNTEKKSRRNSKRADKRIKRKNKKNKDVIKVSDNIKDYCHVYKSKNSSSKRSQAAFMASIDHQSSLNKGARKHQNKKSNKKNRKQQKMLIPIMVPKEQKVWTHEEIKNTVLVFDGGNVSNPPIQPPPNINWTAIRINDETMHIPDCDSEHGLYFPSKTGGPPPFIRVPRKDALSITGMDDMEQSNLLADAFISAINHTQVSNTRGGSRTVFSPYKVANLGVQPCRAAVGLRQYSKKNDKIPSHLQHHLARYMSDQEIAYESIVATDIIRHTVLGRHINGYPLASSNSGMEVKSLKHFSALNISADAFLPCHKDDDFTKSIVSAHLNNHQYTLDDIIIAFMCFPSKGVAVPLRPGDMLVFNPTEPHCISSKCNKDVTLFTSSMYLKTAVVGGNDNSIDLSGEQEALAQSYKVFHSKK